jgi:alpha-galactosidase
MYSLDTTHPEVAAHLENVARELVGAGFGYLKLDFTFAPSVDGRWHDPSCTPAERVRAGFDAIRRGAGDAFLLGCGVPLANVVGVVDGCRIGADVAPCWELDPADEVVAGYLDVQPATRSAFVATVARSFLHRRLWTNDPDCIMLRTSETDLAPEAAASWAQCVGLSGGSVVISDDLGLLGSEDRARFREVVALAAESDADARRGRPPVAQDLLEHPWPSSITTPRHALTVELEDGAPVGRP